jgi:S1-C subfamily serine protease
MKLLELMAVASTLRTVYKIPASKLKDLQKIQNLVDEGAIRGKTLDSLCAQHDVTATELRALQTVTASTSPQTNSAQPLAISSPDLASVTETGVSPTVRNPRKKSIDALLASKQQHVDLGGGRKKSTMLYSGDTPLGMHLVPTKTGQGVIVEGVSGQMDAHADASNVGQVLLSVNGIDVSNMPLAEVLSTLQANRPATLVFMHPETKVQTQTHVDLGGGRKKSTMFYNGDSPLGMHLIPTSSGQGVIVEGVSDQSAHADASNVGQVLLSVNGIDVTGMPLPQVLQTLQENRPADLVFMHPGSPDNMLFWGKFSKQLHL